MKNSNWKKVSIILLASIWSVEPCAQITPGQLRQYISDSKYSIGIKQFYNQLNYQPAWIRTDGNANSHILLEALKHSAGLGLREKDYEINDIEAFCNGTVSIQNLNDSLEAELRITNAAIHFYNDIAYGNIKPALGYNGLNYEPNCRDIPVLLAEHILKGQLPILPKHLAPSLAEIPAIENKIRWFQRIMADTNFMEVTLISGKVSGTNKPLITKLYQFGVLDSQNKDYPDSTLKQRVREVQQQFNLVADGLIRGTIMQELNIPVAVRLQQLNLSVNYYRWLYCLTSNQSVIVVNIPSASLKVYRGAEIILEMRMIVGKRSTPTPTLLSRVDEVILYPYWHVPYSIATRELLPAIKRNPGFVDAGNYQVLNREGKIIEPYAVDWHAYSTKYFPFILRQSTGCDNALGLLKLNFYSPFGVYLHDTPSKNLFMLKRRYFSHGCMRMEKPMELGHLVLQNNQIAIDTLEQKGCLRNQSPILVPADEHMPVIVWYNPVAIDSTGRVMFCEDIYRKFGWTRRK